MRLHNGAGMWLRTRRGQSHDSGFNCNPSTVSVSGVRLDSSGEILIKLEAIY